MILRIILPIACILIAAPAAVSAQDKSGAAPTAEMQKHFSEAYNRGDVDAMAAAFTENAVRVTPSGIFEGRDAIRGSFQEALKLGLHDHSAKILVSRPEGGLLFNAGTWQAKLGDHPFHGYYSAIIVQQDGQPKILEETVTVAAP